MKNDNYRKVITRNYSSESDVVAQELPMSGINMSYQSKHTGVLGRLMVGSYQHLMPHDKFSGKNSASVTFDRITEGCPIVPDMYLRSHNFMVTLRAIDQDFEELNSPSKLNNMGAGLHAPMFKLSTIVRALLQPWFALTWKGAPVVNVPWHILHAAVNSVYAEILFEEISDESRLDALCDAVLATVTPYRLQLAKTYADDACFDLTAQMAAGRPTFAEYSADNQLLALWIRNAFVAFMDFFIGQGSLLESLGYFYLSHDRIAYVSQFMPPQIWDNNGFVWLLSGMPFNPNHKPDGFLNEIPMNEYALRAYLAVWIEYWRNTQLEELTPFMRYKKWSSVSILEKLFDDSTNYEALALLVTRICPWDEDMFTSAQIDDICRNVYAPILSSDNAEVSFNSSSAIVSPAHANDSLDMMMHTGLQSTSLEYIDGDGNVRYISCPVPSDVSRALSLVENGLSDMTAYALDLHVMRQSQRLERYLKRNFFFGDEYRDRMKAHYGVDIADAYLNRPKWLGGTIQLVQGKQEVSNAGTSTTPMGTRTATATGSYDSDVFADFSEEFAVFLNIVTVTPMPQYDPLCRQNTFNELVDFPIPEFAASNEDLISCFEITRSMGNVGVTPFGHAPYAHSYRSRVNSVHGKFLDEYAKWTCVRFFSGETTESVPRLNYQFLHCRPVLPMFVDPILLDGQFFIVANHEFLCERVLPTPVEVI